MNAKSATLHMLCGKVAAGKSTLAAKLAGANQTVLIGEDAWLHLLYANEIKTLRDFQHRSLQLREAMAPHIASLLRAGLSVVLDFHANTIESRVWMRGIIEETSAAHVLHVMTPPDAVCLARLRQRNAFGTHEFQVTEDHFRQVAEHFVAPKPEEGFNIVLHT